MVFSASDLALLALADQASLPPRLPFELGVLKGGIDAFERLRLREAVADDHAHLAF
jgi:hypothetical protein